MNKKKIQTISDKKRQDGSKHPQIVLVGQPNCGKSTLFNEVAGYRAVTSNFPGVTVTYTRSHIRIGDRVYNIIDLPGIYSLTSLDQADLETQRYLLSERVDVIINVIDASIMSRSLELTLQLLELEIPMVLCLNMIDEAKRKGIEINTEKLSDKLGIPIVKTVASKGKGVKSLFEEVLKMVYFGKKGKHIRGNRDVELVIARLKRILTQNLNNEIPFSKHLLATKLLEHDRFFENKVKQIRPELMEKISACRRELAISHGRSSDEVINAERHALSMSIVEQTCTVKKPQLHWRDRIDEILMHNIWGYLFLVIIFILFFNLIFRVGSLIETPMVAFFERAAQSINTQLNPELLYTVILTKIFEGIGGGIAIVLPYLFPFLMGLAFFEDIGYLPRVAFLMDTFMHRIGLHGKAVIPAVLGYGCNVPAVMGTRILESPRDRFISAFIATMIPCAARMTIIMGLVGYYLGGNWALMIYLLNLIVVALSGTWLSRILPEVTPGMVLEIPVYQMPRLKIMLRKTWLRLKDFIIIAWPLLIAGSAILGLIDHYQLTDKVNHMLSPVTVILGLPAEVGTTLIFGVLKKELSMLMLFQALGTTEILTVMSKTQILVFTIFVVFYIPCVATIGVLYRQLRGKRTLFIVGFTFILALILGLLTRGLGELIF
ncbi:ferrous iron transport protein B [bacterium]|nr:ferrous iron transport protein B [bacterium]RQV94378.1 MAG: ferrous iron transport protein B [bacterium]